MYKLSKDYKLLFKKICEGNEVACFVDYRYRTEAGFEKHPCRDICKIKRHGEYDIKIGARGISYGDIYPFNKKDGTEKDIFINSCKAANIEWIQP